jgi:hypothetical protein
MLTLRQYDAVVVSARAHLKRQMALSFALRDFVDGQPTSIWLGMPPDLPRVLIRCYQAMLRAMEISASSMLRLTEPVDDHVRDCFPIARSIIEIGVNLAYIAAMGEKAAEQARGHSLWRSVTDLERRREFGALKLHHRARSLDELDDIPGMRDAVEWIAHQGPDVPRRRDWTDLPVPQRIAVVLEKRRHPTWELPRDHDGGTRGAVDRTDCRYRAGEAIRGILNHWFPAVRLTSSCEPATVHW